MKQSQKIVRVRVAPIGVHFGFCGQIIARNGRVLTETTVVPYPEAAERDAMALVTNRGWILSSSGRVAPGKEG